MEYMHEESCVCMTVYMNTSQGDRVSENAKLLLRRVCVSLDWAVAKQQYRLRCNTLPQEMKRITVCYTVVLLETCVIPPNFSLTYFFIVYV